MGKRKKRGYSDGLNAAQGAVGIGVSATTVRVAADAANSAEVAATAGPGITKGLKAAGDLVGGGMAAGPMVLSAGAGCIVSAALNTTVFRDDDAISDLEVAARADARRATMVGAAAGVAGVRIVTTAGGSSGPEIMRMLSRIGPGGAIAGLVVLAVAPAVTAGAAGFGVYQWRKRGGSSPGQALGPTPVSI